MAEDRPALAAGERFFRPVDWLAFAITTLIALVGYCLTISPDLTLEDSGELAVASMYAVYRIRQGTRSGRCTRGCSPSWFRSRTSRFVWRYRRRGGGADGPLALLTSRASSRITRASVGSTAWTSTWPSAWPCERLRGRVDAGVQRFHVEPGGNCGGVHFERAVVDGAVLPVPLTQDTGCVTCTGRFSGLHLSVQSPDTDRGGDGDRDGDPVCTPATGEFFTVNSIVYLVILC